MADLAAALPAGQMPAEGDGGRHAAAAALGLPSRSRSAWCPVRDPPVRRRPPLSQGGLAD